MMIGKGLLLQQADYLLIRMCCLFASLCKKIGIKTKHRAAAVGGGRWGRSYFLVLGWIGEGNLGKPRKVFGENCDVLRRFT
jgi:hypothetical protein